MRGCLSLAEQRIDAQYFWLGVFGSQLFEVILFLLMGDISCALEELRVVRVQVRLDIKQAVRIVNSSSLTLKILAALVRVNCC